MIFMRHGMQSIKFEKVIAIWEDINSCDSAWNSEDDLRNLKPAMCNTIGIKPVSTCVHLDL